MRRTLGVSHQQNALSVKVADQLAVVLFLGPADKPDLAKLRRGNRRYRGGETNDGHIPRSHHFAAQAFVQRAGPNGSPPQSRRS